MDNHVPQANFIDGAGGPLVLLGKTVEGIVMEEAKAARSADQRGHGVLGGVREGDDRSGRAVEVDIDFTRRGARQQDVEERVGGQPSAEIFTIGAKKADLIFEHV